MYKASYVPLYKVDKSRIVTITMLGPIRLKPTSSRDIYSFEKLNGDNNIVFELSFSGVFEIDDKIRYEFSKKDVIVYLIVGNCDE